MIRDKVLFAKTKLKVTGITESEFLMKSGHDVFLEARKRFGVGKCWTMNASMLPLDIIGDFSTCLIKKYHSSTHLKSVSNNSNMKIVPYLPLTILPNCNASLLASFRLNNFY